MGMTIADLQPKNFKITVKGIEVDCKPPRLSHVLVMSKVGEVFQDIKGLSRDEIIQTEADFDWVISELLPELKGAQLDAQIVLDVITQIMEKITPDETKALDDAGVTIDADPKVKTTG